MKIQTSGIVFSSKEYNTKILLPRRIGILLYISEHIIFRENGAKTTWSFSVDSKMEKGIHTHT